MLQSTRRPFISMDLALSREVNRQVQRNRTIPGLSNFVANNPLFVYTFVLIVFRLFVILVISYFGFESRICLLIAPVPVHCVLVTFLLYKT